MKKYILNGHYSIKAAILENHPFDIQDLTRTKAMERHPEKVKQIEQGLFD